MSSPQIPVIYIYICFKGLKTDGRIPTGRSVIGFKGRMEQKASGCVLFYREVFSLSGVFFFSCCTLTWLGTFFRIGSSWLVCFPCLTSHEIFLVSFLFGGVGYHFPSQSLSMLDSLSNKDKQEQTSSWLITSQGVFWANMNWLILVHIILSKKIKYSCFLAQTN